jgi:antitoxin (DNA-binding transcriptional repressor) of toxin-antitoxin stability system
MAVLHITEAELARDLHAVLEKARNGMEVVVAEDHRPVVVIQASPMKGRMISEVIAALEASGANATVDEDFARDVEEAVNLYREPWNPPSGE